MTEFQNIKKWVNPFASMMFDVDEKAAIEKAVSQK